MERNAFYCMRYYVTFRCNSRCSYCNVWQEEAFRSVSELPLERAKELVRQCWELGVRYIDFTGGEPTLYRPLPELIGYARELGIKTEVTTNGLRCDGTQMGKLICQTDKLNLSLDTLDPEKYRRIRGVDGQAAAAETLKIIAEGRRERGARPPKMMVTVSRDNRQELEALLEFAGRYQTEVYLNPVFPYGSRDWQDSMDQSLLPIARQLYRPYSVVMLHFLEFYRDGGAKSGVPCSANRQTITVAPDGALMLPCYHGVQQRLPWDRPVEQLVTSPEFLAWQRGTVACANCVVSPYFGISFNYWLDKYFLLQSYSEKLHHLKERYLNRIPELVWDGAALEEKLTELLCIVRSLRSPPRGEHSGLFAPEVYRDPAHACQTAQDCWGLTHVPHREFDRVCETVYKAAYEGYCRGQRREEAIRLFQNAMEFQLRWWCAYISRYLNVAVTCDLDREERWLAHHARSLRNWWEPSGVP